MILNGTGFMLQTMLMFANVSEKSPDQNTVYDFLQSPLGADSGKYPNPIELIQIQSIHCSSH